MSATRRQSGFSMIELLVAMAIGGFLIIGAVTMQSNTRKTFSVNEQQGRLQETARYVISVLEPEIELAGGYGYTNRPEDITYAGTGTFVTMLRTWSTQVGGLPAGLESCGKHYAVDIISSVQAANNAYSLTCAAQGGGHNGTSDTITIRHAGTVAVAGDPTKFQLVTSRLCQGCNQLYVGATPVVDPSTDVQVRDMVVNSYYVARRSDARSDIPALRAKILTTNGAAPFVDDQEVIRGVEDIQVEFGVDSGIDQDGDGIADYVSGLTNRYVAPDNAVVRTGQVSAVRLWVRVRAEDPEQGFTDNRTYTYAGTTFTPAANDHYRRVLMSRTIYLRNARGMEIVDALPPP